MEGGAGRELRQWWPDRDRIRPAMDAAAAATPIPNESEDNLDNVSGFVCIQVVSASPLAGTPSSGCGEASRPVGRAEQAQQPPGTATNFRWPGRAQPGPQCTAPRYEEEKTPYA